MHKYYYLMKLNLYFWIFEIFTILHVLRIQCEFARFFKRCETVYT
eukprot:UN16653